jgi:FAD/FMN-containing dehydrogenase
VHNFRNIEHKSEWRIPGSKDTANVLICGGGTNWGSAYIAANEANRSVVGAEDVTVGIGGQLTNGGHGTLSSYHGLSSDHLYQATVITTEGRRLVVNDEQNQDMFWAIRGAGGGVFGVVTELVIKTNPRPENAVSSALTFYARDSSRPMEDAAWAAFAEIVSQFPDLMDAGVTGTVDTMTGQMAKKYLPLPYAVAGPAVSAKLFAFNTTVESMRHKIRKLVNSIEEASKGNLSILVTEPCSESFWSWGRPEFRSSDFAGSSRVFSGRLLGRAELSDLRREDLDKYLRQILVAEHPDGGNMLRFDLQAGSGPAKVPKKRWASENWYWRKAYVLAMVWGAHVNATEDPSNALNSAIDWYEENQEAVWRKWAPIAGAYLNAANGFSRSWKHDFYGNKYDKLLKIKEKYDPTESLWSYSGVGSEKWKYDLHSGLLCQAGKSSEKCKVKRGGYNFGYCWKSL